MQYDAGGEIYKNDWYMHWNVGDTRALLKTPIDDALQEIADEVKKQVDIDPGNQLPEIPLFGVVESTTLVYILPVHPFLLLARHCNPVS